MFILFIFLEKIILSEVNRFKSIFLLTVYSLITAYSLQTPETDRFSSVRMH